MPKSAKNLDHVHRASDGRLMATSFLIGVCGDPSCENIHLDLEDKRGEVFATAVFSPDQCGMLISEMAQHIKTGGNA